MHAVSSFHGKNQSACGLFMMHSKQLAALCIQLGLASGAVHPSACFFFFSLVEELFITKMQGQKPQVSKCKGHPQQKLQVFFWVGELFITKMQGQKPQVYKCKGHPQQKLQVLLWVGELFITKMQGQKPQVYKCKSHPPQKLQATHTT